MTVGVVATPRFHAGAVAFGDVKTAAKNFLPGLLLDENCHGSRAIWRCRGLYCGAPAMFIFEERN